MSTFERTEAGFAEAMKAAQWYARFHGKPCALLVPRIQADKYAISMPSLVRPDDVEPGTAANLIHPDGNQTRMFADE